SLVALGNFLQVSAFRHARHLGFDYTRKDGFDGLWVLIRMLIKMDTYPAWLDNISIRTWHRGTDGFVAMRDYEIVDEQGNRLGAVASHWFVLDPETRRVVEPKVDEYTLSTLHPVKAMEESPERIIIRTDLPLIRTVTVNYTDLDMYHHVNNTRYIDWILNLYPMEMHRDYRVSSLMIEFLSEARVGEEIMLFAGIQTAGSLVKGVRSGDEKTIFKARLEWRKSEK
ncbi:MAG: acyl-[acyl-carrier-protein] thioesterase, partial [Syntrophothermus sp.]